MFLWETTTLTNLEKPIDKFGEGTKNGNLRQNKEALVIMLLDDYFGVLPLFLNDESSFTMDR